MISSQERAVLKRVFT